MKAILCRAWGGPDTLTLEDVASRDPAAGEVKIRVRAAGVNFPDVLIIQKKYQIQPPLPFSPGAEVAGDVISVGSGVSHLRAGDKVVCFCGVGGFAEEVIAPAAVTIPMTWCPVSTRGHILIGLRYLLARRARPRRSATR